MNCVGSRRGVRLTPPPPLKPSCNYFFFEASRVSMPIVMTCVIKLASKRLQQLVTMIVKAQVLSRVHKIDNTTVIQIIFFRNSEQRWEKTESSSKQEHLVSRHEHRRAPETSTRTVTVGLSDRRCHLVSKGRDVVFDEFLEKWKCVGEYDAHSFQIFCEIVTAISQQYWCVKRRCIVTNEYCAHRFVFR